MNFFPLKANMKRKIFPFGFRGKNLMERHTNNISLPDFSALRENQYF